jgi:hypothetical protein
MERLTSQQSSSLSRATLGLSFSSPRELQNSSFSSLAKKDFFSVVYSKDAFYKYFYS